MRGDRLVRVPELDAPEVFLADGTPVPLDGRVAPGTPTPLPGKPPAVSMDSGPLLVGADALIPDSPPVGALVLRTDAPDFQLTFDHPLAVESPKNMEGIALVKS